VITEPSVEASLPTIMLVQFSGYPGPSEANDMVDWASDRKGANTSKRIKPAFKRVLRLWFFMSGYFMENIKLAKNFREVNITLNKNKTDNQ
jgi:hypothetical protein